VFVTPLPNLAQRYRERRGRGRASALSATAQLLRAPAGQAFGLMTMRSMTIAVKFALTLFITRYLGLAELGLYGIITSIAALGPVLLGFGVANNLGREAARHGAASIALPVLQYFLFLVPAYAGLCVIGMAVWPDRAGWLCLLAVLLFLDHLQTEMFSLMTLTGSAYEANVAYFIRFALWSIVYIPLALFEPGLRNLTTVLAFWLAGCVVATALTLVFTRHWRWGSAARRLRTSKLQLPHQSGSMALYVADSVNASFVYLDRYIVGLFLNVQAIGIYVLYWSITNALNNIITISVVQIKRGELVKVAHVGGDSLHRALVSVCFSSGALALAMGAMATVMMYFVVPHLGRPEVVAYLPLMFILCAGLLLRTIYEVIGISFYAYGRDDLTLYSVVGVLVVALVLNLWLDPTVGIWGAGLALAVSYAAGVIGRLAVIVRGFQRRAPPSALDVAEEDAADEAIAAG
jgi:O-antigen/teichoic acid export membrane protein